MKVTIRGSAENLCQLLCKCKHGKGKIVRVVTYCFNGVSFTSKGDKMSTVLQQDDLPGTVDATVAFFTSKGKPATVDGVPTWTASNTNVIDSITPSADGLSAKLHILANVDASNLTVNADVDLGSGVNNKDFVDSISVVAAEAATASFTFGAVTPDAP